MCALTVLYGLDCLICAMARVPRRLRARLRCVSVDPFSFGNFSRKLSVHIRCCMPLSWSDSLGASSSQAPPVGTLGFRV